MLLPAAPPSTFSLHGETSPAELHSARQELIFRFHPAFSERPQYRLWLQALRLHPAGATMGTPSWVEYPPATVAPDQRASSAAPEKSLHRSSTPGAGRAPPR